MIRKSTCAALVLSVVGVTMWIAGCDRGGSGASVADGGGPSAAAAQLPTGLMLASEPAASKGVLAVKQEAKAGDAVVVRGRIGGRKDPFVAERAIFMIADLELPPCGTNPDDKCPIPWDYCCEPHDNLMQNTLTVQVVGADGKPLKVGLSEFSNLRPMADVIIQGRVSSKPDEKTMVIDATNIFVKKT